MSFGGALTHFPCKLGLKKIFFTALGVQVHPLHPLATPMPSRLGRGHPSPLPRPTPLSAFGASILAPSALNFGVPIVVNLRNDHCPAVHENLFNS